MLVVRDRVARKEGIMPNQYSSTPRNHIYLPELKAWKLQLTQGKYALVDEDDFEAVSKHKWYAHPAGQGVYARRDIHSTTGKQRVYLHREILDAPKDAQIDHANYNTLDNRKSNLRLANKMLNMRNRRKVKRHGESSSEYKGVSLVKNTGKWHSYIHVNKRRVTLGYFENELDAARAYNQAAKKWFGEFALLNEI
jgi:hypothetical protein